MKYSSNLFVSCPSHSLVRCSTPVNSCLALLTAVHREIIYPNMLLSFIHLFAPGKDTCYFEALHKHLLIVKMCLQTFPNLFSSTKQTKICLKHVMNMRTGKYQAVNFLQLQNMTTSTLSSSFSVLCSFCSNIVGICIIFIYCIHTREVLIQYAM